MFDAETSQLIRRAPQLRDVNPNLLPQELTRAYAELIGMRLRGAALTDDPNVASHIERLIRIATIYEAAVDTGAVDEQRRSAAFVAATAHQILGVARRDSGAGSELLTPTAIHPQIAAPLLFLIAEQNPDAREAARPLLGRRADDLVRTALLESVQDLANEQFETILERAQRLAGLRPAADMDLSVRAAQALYGLCWSGLVQMVALLLGRPSPQTAFRSEAAPDLVFDNVVALATSDIAMPGAGGALVSTYSGPRHLARLLRHVSAGLTGAGVTGLPPPSGSDSVIWRRWLQHRAQTKPVLWPNHRAAVATGFLEPGRSCVLVLPTGAGKTTLSELKIAAVIAQGRKVIFLVPTLALVDQLRDDLATSFPSGLGDVGVSTDGDLTALVSGPQLKSIEVMTPERCLALLSFADADIADVGLIIFDECHLLSEQGGGKRSVDAMLCLLHVLKRAPVADLLLLSAMISNSGEVAGWLQEVTGRPCTAFHDPWKPSRQARGVVIYPAAEVAVVDAAARSRRRAQGQRQGARTSASLEVTPHALFGLQNNWNPRASGDVRLIRLIDGTVSLALGTTTAAPNANAVAADLAIATIKAGFKVIVFVQQADHAPSTARRLRVNLSGAEQLTAGERALWNDIQAELGAGAHSLIDPYAGALPHNGDMIAAERRLAEALFRRTDGISAIVATPTLAQGMNLPVQVAILAGNMRHNEDTGRAELQRHEILNAAGRAGRAGYLANGTVLLIPEPVARFDAAGPNAEAVAKLQALLPPNDQCVRIDDPLTALIDRVQSGGMDDPGVRYFLSRLRAGESDENAQAGALGMVNRSFAAYQAKQAGHTADFEGKTAGLRAALAGDVDSTDVQATRVAAFTGIPSPPLEAALARINRDLTALPVTVMGWLGWIIDFLAADQEAFKALLGEEDAGTAAVVTRGRKAGGTLTPAEFARLRIGLRAWLEGRAFAEIETALGVAPNRLGVCRRARDLVLKLANRKLYMIAAAIAELAKAQLQTAGVVNANPASLEILAVAIRKGFDSAEKVAFSYLHPEFRTRVAVHKAFAEKLGSRPPLTGHDFRGVINYVESVEIFGQVDLGN